MSNISVLKFGGTSVKTIGRIAHVAEIVAKRARISKVIVVVSAMGDTTDYLVNLAKQCCAAPDRRELDVLLATGEQTSIALLALTLKKMGIKARSFTGPQLGIVTDSEHTDARIIDIRSEVIHKLLQENDVLVVAGFQGVNESGDITTLGRGGSDTTAVALAAASGARDCEIYTDVDGVYTADPNKVKDAMLLPEISYDEIFQMARLGAQVLHHRAIMLAKQYNIRVRVRNTFKPDDCGSLVQGSNEPEAVVTMAKPVRELVRYA